MESKKWLDPDEKIIKKCRWASGGDPFTLSAFRVHTQFYEIFVLVLDFLLKSLSKQRGQRKPRGILGQAGYNALNLYLTNKRIYAEEMLFHHPIANIPFLKIKEIQTKRVISFKMPIIIYEDDGELKEFCFITHWDLDIWIDMLLERINHQKVVLDPNLKKLKSYLLIPTTFYIGCIIIGWVLSLFFGYIVKILFQTSIFIDIWLFLSSIFLFVFILPVTFILFIWGSIHMFKSILDLD